MLKSLVRALLVIVILYILPVSLISVGILPYSLRFVILIVASLLVLGLAFALKLSSDDLGLAHKFPWISFDWLASLTISAVLIMLIYFNVQGPRIDNSDFKLSFYLFFVLVSAPLQEFLYRGFLFQLLSKAGFMAGAQIMISSVLYCFVHIIYIDTPTLVMTFLFGLLWGWHYSRFKNLYQIALSHAILGTTAIFLGLL